MYMVKRGLVLTLAILSVAMLSGCDRYKDAFVSRCQQVTGQSSSDCSCAAGKVKEILDNREWSIFGLVLSGESKAAETEAAKLGFGGMFGLMSKWASALSVAERQCSVRGLSRM
ncbi:hypothetical protein EJC49_04465 [Aquibium carbonis]|uniref:Lipoprotein n=1 Tax=Aquibium carbonis TaxID=2495581 RepID=A0A429Z1P0_9HYPH|nr:hypothetical protein [Aquibium carbonis]RST87607.1 hypothetical protein EJC49_04465 [Aquibium carbonis]